jgi:hypothetical protein
MSTPPSTIRDFARRLLALESERGVPTVAGGREAVRVCEKLRLPLVRLAGVAGFRSLMSRAVAMAKSEVPSLAAVQVRDDGSLEGLHGNGKDPGADAAGDAGVVVVAQLLGLLVTFIGERLTLRLVRDAWPDASIPAMSAESGEQS